MRVEFKPESATDRSANLTVGFGGGVPDERVALSGHGTTALVTTTTTVTTVTTATTLPPTRRS